MSTRALIISIVVILALAAGVALLLRDAGPSESRVTIKGEALGGGLETDDDVDTAADPTQEYIRGLGPPDTSGLALLHDDSDSHASEAVRLPGPAVGELAPPFSLPTVQGGTFHLDDIRERVGVVNFWATWCEPCRDEIPGLITLQDEYRDEGLRIVGISIEEDSRDAVASFIDTFPFNYPLLVDGLSVAEAYGADVAVPTTVVVDRRGRIAARLYGALHRDSLESHVRPLLAGQ